MDTSAPTLTKDPLLDPFVLKGLTLRNRVISTSHASALDDGGMPGERYRAYHVEKARGGIAMTMIGGSAMVSRDSSWGGGQLNLSTDAVIPHLQKLAEEVHGVGAAVMTQISHLGRRAQYATGAWLPVLAPSRVREPRNRAFPREMSRDDIDRIVADYAEAARRAAEAGLDGVETLTGGHLIGQFLSPLTNFRTDGFGGSLENRVRFALMVHDAIRRAVGEAFPIGIRLVVDEGVEGGLTLEDAVAIAQILEREGTVDFFNCIYGLMDSDLTLSEDNMPGMFQKSAPYLPSVEAFRKEVRLPLLHAGGIRDVATARHAIRENLVDLVGMTRAHLADPHLVRKLEAGTEEEIRPCVGASYCLFRKAHCIHNPATTRELTLGHDVPRAARPGRVVVVGGGPAGLEAARVSALRGHRVTLFEAAAQLGGQLRIATRVRERADLLGILDWRESALQRLGVDIRLNSFAEASDILAESPDTVIVATGGIPDLDWLEGADHCLSVWDVLGGRMPSGETALVYDGTGRQAAASCALELSRNGKQVIFATPDDAVAVEMPYQDRSGFRKRFAQIGVEQVTDARLVSVRRTGSGLEAVFRNTYTGEESARSAASVVIEHGTRPLDDVFDALCAASANRGITDMDALTQRAGNSAPLAVQHGFALHRIGDAVASRDVHAAILDAYRLARLI
ncbi:NADH:flavin oxidoreductase [Alloyangia pacifica]|uniref:2,4-dienoyl-CoA reductase n=1 Tax=Alloyangia pacifica TaxID=311180 RepID=A0A1I6UGE7_9RHOB|nr:NADH:flavin oxidoreductase [Alloyangia pacifica]SDH69104.1 2,4-dienoyl-CoA reductase [Alloyangia pacifica]SFT00512.1 2,4-dienoyl-CoA reductase [Alloyangia pacifica]